MTMVVVAMVALPAISVAWVQVGLGALIMLALTPAIAMGHVTLSWRVVGSMILLGTVGTGVAYVWNTKCGGRVGTHAAPSAAKE